MLYSRYSNPMDLVERYIKQRRFGKFVQGFMGAEYERKKQEAERDQEWMLWVAYVHSYSDKSFNDWKKSVMAPTNTSGAKSTADMTDGDIKALYIKFFGAPQPQE